MSEQQDDKPDGNLLIYRADEAAAPIRVLLEGETAWLTQRLLAALYGRSASTHQPAHQQLFTRTKSSPGGNY
jgi:hypothetical protein